MSVGLCRFLHRGLFIEGCIKMVRACRSMTVTCQGYIRQHGLSVFYFWGDIHHLLLYRSYFFVGLPIQGITMHWPLKTKECSWLWRVLYACCFTSLQDHPPLKRFGAIKAMARRCRWWQCGQSETAVQSAVFSPLRLFSSPTCSFDAGTLRACRISSLSLNVKIKGLWPEWHFLKGIFIIKTMSYAWL